MYIIHFYKPLVNFNSLIKSNSSRVCRIFIPRLFLIYDIPLILQVEVKRTKNTERRVQRQVVLEDGRVLNVGGPPHVVVDTIEDIETHETNHVEDQNIIDELKGINFLI